MPLCVAHDADVTHRPGCLRLETARVDLESGSAMGREPVTGQGLFGQIDATGFDSFNQGDRIIFLGPSHLQLYPAAQTDVSMEPSQ